MEEKGTSIFENLLDTIALYQNSGYEAFLAILLSVFVSILPLLLRAIRVIQDQPKDKPNKIDFKYIKENIANFIDKYFPTWQSLKVVSKNKFFRTSFLWFILVPILAKILSKTEQGANFTFQSLPNINITLGVPFSWNLFYFASLSFVIAGIIYSWKAPNVIKKYDNFKDFMEKDKSGVAIINEVEKNLETTSEKTNYLNNLIYHFQWHNIENKAELDNKDREIFRLRTMMEPSDTAMANLYSISIQYLDRKSLFFRVVTTLLYFLSFSFYGYVIFQQSIFVITEFMNS